jgi:hypothetical protein
MGLLYLLLIIISSSSSSSSISSSSCSSSSSSCSTVRTNYACWNYCFAGSRASFSFTKCVTTKFTASWFIISRGI